MASFNKVILMGHLTSDPELKVSKNGISICSFEIATTRDYTTKFGEKREETTFVDIDCFRSPQAETVYRDCNKGSLLWLEGRLRMHRWETETGETRSKLSVVMESFQFFSGRQDKTIKGY